MTQETRTTFEVEEKEETIVSCDNPSCMYQGSEEEFVTFYTHATEPGSATEIYLTSNGEAITKTAQVKSSLDFCHNCLEEMADEDISPEDGVSFDHNGVMTVEKKQPLFYESIPFAVPVMITLLVLGSILISYNIFGIAGAFISGVTVLIIGSFVSEVVKGALGIY